MQQKISIWNWRLYNKRTNIANNPLKHTPYIVASKRFASILIEFLFISISRVHSAHHYHFTLKMKKLHEVRRRKRNREFYFMQVKKFQNKTKQRDIKTKTLEIKLKTKKFRKWNTNE